MLVLRAVQPADYDLVERLIGEHWGSPLMITRGRLIDLRTKPGFIAENDGTFAGLITYDIQGEHCEITSLNSVQSGLGVGSALIDIMKKTAKENGCRRLWLITTNDNMNALRFYQKRAFVLAAVYPNALAISRKLKPEIPLVGYDNIPLRDEIELEHILT